MSEATAIHLVDEDIRRRAAIAHSLASEGIHVEPLESVHELIARWPRSGMILTHDGGWHGFGKKSANGRGGGERTGVVPAGTLVPLMRYMGNSGDWLPVIAYAEHPAPQQIVDAVLEGAVGYFAWPLDRAKLTDAIRVAHQRGERVGTIARRKAVARARVDRLTRREREVLNGVAGGLSNRLIGDHLAISPRTVEIHRANMLTKLGIKHTSEAIRIAIEASLPG